MMSKQRQETKYEKRTSEPAEKETRLLNYSISEFFERRAFWFFFAEKKNNKKGLSSHLRPLNQPQEKRINNCITSSDSLTRFIVQVSIAFQDFIPFIITHGES